MIHKQTTLQSPGDRGGYTLVELLVSMTAATVLMAGLGSSLFIASSAFDGNFDAVKRSHAAEVQEDLMIDLNQATSFVTRAADSVRFRVPDRDDDGTEETLSYSWSGLPTAELQYARNGSPPVTILDNVQDFNLTYLDRLLPGTPLPALQPNQWGQRWTLRTFGYPTVYANMYYEDRDFTAAILAPLSERGTLKSISAYFTVMLDRGNSDVRMAVYDVDANNRPRNLIISTAATAVDSTGWTEIVTPPVPLSPGNYYLAVSIKDPSRLGCSYQLGTTQAYIMASDSVRPGFSSTWGTGSMAIYASGSMYASYKPE